MFKQTLPTLKQLEKTQQQRLFGTLVSPKQLSSALGRVKILDGSWHMPNSNRDPHREFLEKRIVHSRFFDIDGIKDTSSDLPHMLPSPKVFAEAIGELGIDENDHVVVYDSVGIFSACRVYWTFKVFGHRSVSVLNGGLPAWIKGGEPTETGDLKNIKKKHYKIPTLNSKLVRDYHAMLSNAYKAQKGSQEAIQVLDARPYPRFTGEAPEPRQGLSSGHMPGSLSVNFNELIDAEGKLLSDDSLNEVFKDKGVDISKDITTSCGSGITASILYFALERLGAQNVSVYDGSWTEYAGKEGADS
ncbi:Rhodanese-like domain-containing protein [Sporodiniella umbellata]|nr:Rhodanese-like domain-containing protein [Sporodiniella umbellata]